ncbi:MAG: hypothetical protein HQ512_03260 [Rhodospirillales bacterium]|nr:hypothetical protein [Rhodospirillales bacterium]
MIPTLIEIYIGLFMIAVAVGLLIWFAQGEETSTSLRMNRMMKRLGLDPKIRTEGPPETVAMMTAARTRCGRCRCEGLCERWLDGIEGGPNAFCPNTPVFDVLNRTGPFAAA